MESIMEALARLDSGRKPAVTKTSGKKKQKKKKSYWQRRGKLLTSSYADKVVEEFVYSWPKCACGMNHPPVPHFKPPDDIRCTYYWQLSDMFPFMTLYRVLSTEIKFIQADADQSGLIELDELKTILKSVCGDDVTDKMVEKTFKEIDEDENDTLDFTEVLKIIDTLVQRKQSDLPNAVLKGYSKVCSIQ